MSNHDIYDDRALANAKEMAVKLIRIYRDELFLYINKQKEILYEVECDQETFNEAIELAIESFKQEWEMTIERCPAKILPANTSFINTPIHTAIRLTKD